MESINNATSNTTNTKANSERKLVRFSNSITTSSKLVHANEGCKTSLILKHEKTTSKSSSLLKKEDSLGNSIKSDLNETNIRQIQVNQSNRRHLLATSLSSPIQSTVEENISALTSKLNAKLLNRHNSTDSAKTNKPASSYSGINFKSYKRCFNFSDYK